MLYQLVGAVHVSDRRQLVVAFGVAGWYATKFVHFGSARHFAAHSSTVTLSPSSILYSPKQMLGCLSAVPAGISLKHLRPGPGAGPGDGGGGVGPGGVGPGGVGPPPHAGPLCLKYESTEAQLVGAVHVCDRRQLVLPFTEVATMKLVHSGSARQFAAHADFGTLSPSSIV